MPCLVLLPHLQEVLGEVASLGPMLCDTHGLRASYRSASGNVGDSIPCVKQGHGANAVCLSEGWHVRGHDEEVAVCSKAKSEL